MKNLNDKVVVITGAAGGMGREMAIQAAQQGALLAISDWNDDALNETADLCKQAGGKRVRADKVDVSDREAMKTKFEAMRAEHKARLESFTKDTFDANAFLAKPANAPEPGKGMKGMHEHMLNELAAITEVLTPAQREKLAAKIEKGPEHKGPPPGAR